jgi:hypothetical protein
MSLGLAGISGPVCGFELERAWEFAPSAEGVCSIATLPTLRRRITRYFTRCLRKEAQTQDETAGARRRVLPTASALLARSDPVPEGPHKNPTPHTRSRKASR